MLDHLRGAQVAHGAQVVVLLQFQVQEGIGELLLAGPGAHLVFAEHDGVRIQLVDHGVLVVRQVRWDHEAAALEAHGRELQGVALLGHEAEVTVHIADRTAVRTLDQDAGEGHGIEAVARDHHAAELQQLALGRGVLGMDTGEQQEAEKEVQRTHGAKVAWRGWGAGTKAHAVEEVERRV